MKGLSKHVGWSFVSVKDLTVAKNSQETRFFHRRNGPTDRPMDGWTNGRTDGRTDGQTDGPTEGPKDGETLL